MPVRIRKSITLFPGVWLNFSKSGVSLSVGKKGGFTLNFSKRGIRQTTDLPGEGLYHTSYLFKKKKDDSERDEDKKEPEDEESSSEDRDKPKRRTRRTIKESASSPWGFFLFVFVALFFIYFGANAFGLLPPNLLTNFLQTLTQWAKQVGL